MPLDKGIKYRTHKRKRPLILVTNDDGIHADGLKALASSLARVGDILIVAPTTEQSATSHALSLYKPLRCDKVRKGVYGVDGTPTDCINLGVHLILKGHKPDLIFSGINRGPNLGDDIHYSGTVSAAMEGGLMGIPSVAVSVGYISRVKGDMKYGAAGAFAAKVASTVLKKGLPKGVILNVNVPSKNAHEIKGYKITCLGKKNYSNIMSENIDPRGRKYYWIHGEETGHEDIKGSDCNAISEDHISITPIIVDPTSRSFIGKMKKWRF